LEKILLIAVVGGGLQGVEVAYLSKKAGWEVMVLDKNSDPPAKGLVDYFVQVDVCRMDQASGYLEKADLVLPALENDKALETLALWQKSANTPLCFDLKSYNLSSSKKRSNNLFTRLGIPKPLDWPECGFPIVVKPSLGSGSQGVRIISSEVEWVELVKEPLVQGQLLEEKWVIEEYVNGPSYSLEIIGSPGNYKTLQVTELYMDSDYHCPGYET
jgi:pyrrolysine biosynthesis protein PylC